MRSKSGVWSLLPPAAALIGLIGCAGSAPPPASASRAPASSPAPVPAFASAADARARLLQLEDRRSYDAAVLGAASKFPDPAVRAHAVLAAGRIGDERGRDLARAMLSDGSPEVRGAAAFACQLLDDGPATPDLIPLLSDPDPRVAGSAAQAIGAMGRGDGQDALVAAIPGAAAPEPRAAMLQSLWHFADEQSVAAALPYASDPDVKVRSAALYTLSRKPIESSRAALTAALADSDADAAAGAARALGILGKSAAFEPLAATLDSGKPHLVTSSLNALEAILEKNPGTALSADRRSRVIALSGDANPNLAIPALVLLRQFVASDRESLQRVWSIATTGLGRRRQVALLSAVAAMRDRAKAALDLAAASPDAPLRAAAAESLSYLSSAPAAPYRASLAADPSPLVRISVLGGLRTAEAVGDNRALVDAAFSDPDSGVRASAVESLAFLNDSTVLPQVLQAVQKSSGDEAPDVAIAAITAAEKLRSVPEARAVVEAAYRLPKTLTQRLARRSLVRYFRADSAAYPVPEYKISRTLADYAAILAEAGKPWKADVETVRGTFTLRLEGAVAPMTVLNFVDLARKKFFDGVAIHRVVPDFVVQDGDPTGTGNGGPGYEIRDENNQIPYGTGTAGMALAGPDTGGSQWFVTQAPEPHLDGIYTVFGQVTGGQDVVERIEQWDRITRVTVSEAP
jgi:cyclophilin family peptidyl-prolyl cis-trans isomerase/HEAT repeat protein